MTVREDGAVAVTLDGRERLLQPTLGAIKAVNRRFGDLGKAIERVLAQDFEAMVDIAAAGLGEKPARIEAAVFAAGTIGLIVPLTRFLAVLGNGGRPLPRAEEDDGEAGADPAPGETGATIRPN